MMFEKEREELLSLKRDGCYFVYKQKDIKYIQQEGRTTVITFQNHERAFVSSQLSHFEQKLSKNMFIRIHKSVIVNMDYLTRFIGNIVFIDKEELPIDKVYKPLLLTRLNILK